ncbi:lithostathine-2-like [Mytilus trossulus]|uniref:lithostathine-2-like n=1 Tax=Mytilus trossulus TaxID=6551 RepID=UPI003004DF09
MARVAMITLLVVICTIFVEARWKRGTAESEFARIQNSVPYYWEVICDYQYNGVCRYRYKNHKTGQSQETQPPPPGPEDLNIPAPVPISTIDRGRCKEGWYNWFGGGACYYISAFNDTKTHSEATEACKNLGGELFYATTMGMWELGVAGSFAKQSKIRTHYFWTSGHKVNGKWNWGNNHGPVLNKMLQYSSQPAGTPDQGDCLAKYLYRDNISIEKNCNLKYNYVCKIKLPRRKGKYG